MREIENYLTLNTEILSVNKISKMNHSNSPPPAVRTSLTFASYFLNIASP